jgi:UDP-N-acetylglucosamine--N-acetylmuramyl-(pentapeptide) pyrophosphoryl-undecaprenol N-acetylglucosamine transferase
LSISELCIVGKPVILIPSPNVSEDHQTKNAMALVNKEAAILVKDAEAKQFLAEAIIRLNKNKQQLDNLSTNIKQMARTNAAAEIAATIINEISE